MTFRGFLMWVHLVLGLTGALFLVIVGATGAYITFQKPLERWLNPVPAIPEFTGHADLAAIVRVVEDSFPSRRVANVDVRTHEATVVRLRDRSTVFVDPRQAAIIGSRPMRFASLENLTAVMRRLHISLLMGPKGRFLVTAATAEALLLALTGLWLWWRKKGWRFGKLRGSIFRISWDLHNATGLWFLIPVVVMAITGILLELPQPVYRMAGPPAPFHGPPPGSMRGDSTQQPVILAVALGAADNALPAQPTRQLTIPAGPQGAYAIEKQQATVFVDQYSGAVLGVRPRRVPSAGDSTFLAVHDLHTGELLGPIGQGIMTLGSLALVLMTLTGVVLGWKRLLILVGKMSD